MCHCAWFFTIRGLLCFYEVFILTLLFNRQNQLKNKTGL